MEPRILLAHGGGGGASHRLIQEVFYRYLGNDILLQGNDAAVFDVVPGKLAMTTDCFVVQPIFFRGGDIGKLAVCGTVNDLAVSGARPLYLSLGLIIEEGLPVELLEKVVASIAAACLEAGVKIVTGDTKVVEKGKADQLFINTTGLGIIPESVRVGGEMARPGDLVLINGNIGEHGLAVMSERAGINWETPILSDCAALHGLIAEAMEAGAVHCLRDPTRGGLATTLNEISRQSHVGIILEENAIPVSGAVRGASEMLGFDPLYLANEGKVVVIAPPASAKAILERMRRHPLGKDSAIIGQAVAEHPGLVALKTSFGGERLLDMLEGEMLPRIC